MFARHKFAANGNSEDLDQKLSGISFINLMTVLFVSQYREEN